MAYELARYPVYRESDPAQAVGAVSPDQFFDEAYTPVLLDMIRYVVRNKALFLIAHWLGVLLERTVGYEQVRVFVIEWIGLHTPNSHPTNKNR